MPRNSTPDLDWDALLRDFRNSGLTHVAFCQHRGIPLHTFRRRLYQVRTSETTSRRTDPPTAPDPRPGLLPVTILADPPRTDCIPHRPLELILPHGRRLAVAPGFDAHTLRRLLAVLEEPPCSD